MRSIVGKNIVLFLLLLSFSFCLQADEFARAIDESGSVFWLDSAHAERLIDLPAAELVQKIQLVAHKPCVVDFCRIVHKDHPSKIAIEVPLDVDVVPEENGKPFAIVTRPIRAEKYKPWIEYLSGQRDSDGSRDFQTSLLLRRLARIIKLNVFLQQSVGVNLAELSDEHLSILKDNEEFSWLLNDVFEPVTVILEPELKKKMGISLSKPGPAFCRYPALTLLDGGGQLGCLEDGGKLVLRRTDSCLFLGDIKDTLTIEEAIAEDSLGDIMGHEVFHAIMFDMMGEKAPGKQTSLSKNGHDAHVVSDYSLALSEGWAELFEAWSGIDNEAFDNRHGKSTVTRFILGRQVPIRRNKYVQADFEKFRNTKKRGKIKTGSQMAANEGLVAGLLYIVLTHEKIDNPFSLILEAMYKNRPQNLCEMFQALVDCSPDSKTQRIIHLIFLHNTKFATVSGDARMLYQEAYKARLDYFAAKNAKLDLGEIATLQEESQTTKQRYYQFIKPIAEQVQSGDLPLDECLGPEIWLDLRDEDNRLEARRNLNTVSAHDLVMFDISGTGVMHIMKVRDKLGCITSMDDLRGLSQSDLERLATLMDSFEATQR